MLDLEFAGLTETGLVREHNEDFIGHVAPANEKEVQSLGWLFALADGVGGQERGEVASRIAVETALERFRAMPKGVMHVSLLPKLMQEANEAVFEAGVQGMHRRSAHPEGRMATTLVLCALRFDSAVISHVGDSRCYLMRAGKLSALTRDHSMADEQVRLGIISREEAEESESRNVLTRSLGTEMFVAADTLTVNVLPGDLLLLCSDGLHGYVPHATIQRRMESSSDLNIAARELIAAAIASGGRDNVSVQLIRIRAVERMGLYRGRPYRLL